ncbi:MAG: UDP-N-acetylmuramoyl-L-alanyl-D-glutamate--2,6-diaminopimelate ligase [Victivallaceae bacterium]
MKTLSAYIECLRPLITTEKIAGNPVISEITNDSRKVSTGCIFIAIKGAAADGHKYISQAISNGAVAIIHHSQLDEYSPGVSYLQVSDAYFAYASVCECRFDFPARQLRLHGITGTNGKTTTAFILEKILSSCGRKCGLISTVAYKFRDYYTEASRTTPEAYELQELFRKMADSGCTDVIMEVSSHGLDQHRPGHAVFHTAIFTNLTGDHLDYHLNMENYFQAKLRLFREYINAKSAAVINIDDAFGDRIYNELASNSNVVSFGKSARATSQLDNIQLAASGTKFTLKLKNSSYQIETRLIGEHNAFNLSGALLAAVGSGIPAEQAVEATRQTLSVPGRLETFTSPAGVTFFVDYAHTDDALRNVLTILRTIAEKRIITVFGCGGNRDKTKRPRMGRVAAEFSDLVIITSDNPRFEDPLQIIQEIKPGIPEGHPLIIEPDREKAIQLAAKQTVPGDIVLIAGKGHEPYQEQNGILSDFDDRKIVIEICAG